MFSLLALLPIIHVAHADPPPLRDQLSLNGDWSEGGAVPVYAGQEVTTKIYSRDLSIPASWTGKTIKLEFGGVNFSAEIFIDDAKVGEHVGAWLPFAVDVTRHVRPGAACRLKVVVKGRRQQPSVDTQGRALWPMGDVWSKEGDDLFGGIVDDVWLRAYGPVHIADAWIRTSVREKKLSIQYTLRNAGDGPRTVAIHGAAIHAATDQSAKEFTTAAVTMAPHTTQTINIEVPWPDPALWWPDARPELYHLVSRVIEGQQELDCETRRFGFRELWIDGNQFRLNGIRFNLRTDFVEYGQDWPAWAFERKNWPAVIDRLRDLNINSFRTHKYPAPRFVYDIADEKGMVIVAESGVNGDAKGFMRSLDRVAYMRNCEAWTADWVRGMRNHAAILLWTSGNELYNSGMHGPEARRFGAVIRAQDPTRPVLHEGLKDIGEACVSYHYPRQGTERADPWNGEPWNRAAGVYEGWHTFIRPDKPVCAGEALNVPGRMAPVPSERRNIWWHGIWTRGMRWQGWAQIGPGEVFNWVLKERRPDDIKICNLSHAYAPVALFDRGYDDLGIAPFVGDGTGFIGRWPEVQAGVWLDRTLVIYNDEFRDTAVTIEVQIRVDGKVHASGKKTLTVELGEHREIPCRFQVPFAGSGEMELVLRTSKGGAMRFQESRWFRVQGRGAAGASSPMG